MTSGVFPPHARDSCEQLFLSHLATIEAVVAFIARQHHLTASDAEELAGVVRLKLVEDDCAILRKFQGRSSIRTYLTTVVQRLFLDDRIARWGKWRPSAEAKRLGPLAMLVERLTSRDGLTLEEAYGVLETNHGVRVGRPAIEAIFARLPTRIRRRSVGEDAMEDCRAAGAEADRDVMTAEQSEAGARTGAALARAIAALPAQDRLILRLRFNEGLTVADIARAMRLDQKPLYRRIDGLLAALRADLERQGVSGPEVLELLGRPEVELSEILGERVSENPPSRPSV